MADFTVLGTTILKDMFQVGLPVAEKILRPIVVYLFLVLFLRIFGKRELAQLNPFDLVVLLSLSNTVQNAIIGEDNSVSGGLIGAFTLLAVNYLVVRFLFGHRRLDELFEGGETALVQHGRIVEAALAKELITRPELETVFHRQGFRGLKEVERCVLEPGGTFSIEGKEPPAAERQHGEIVARLDELAAKIEELKRKASGEAPW